MLQSKLFLFIFDLMLLHFNKSFAESLAIVLEEEFEDKVSVITRPVKELGDRFEVIVDGELAHSKATRRQGVCSTEDERNAVIKKVIAKLDEKK
jgi:hypothetical protein